MAVTTSKTTKFSNLVHYLESNLSQLEDFSHRWSELNKDTKDDFIIEWPVVEDRVVELKELVKRHGVESDQLERYKELLERIDRDRLVLESLREQP